MILYKEYVLNETNSVLVENIMSDISKMDKIGDELKSLKDLKNIIKNVKLFTTKFVTIGRIEQGWDNLKEQIINFREVLTGLKKFMKVHLFHELFKIVDNLYLTAEQFYVANAQTPIRYK